VLRSKIADELRAPPESISQQWDRSDSLKTRSPRPSIVTFMPAIDAVVRISEFLSWPEKALKGSWVDLPY